VNFQDLTLGSHSVPEKWELALRSASPVAQWPVKEHVGEPDFIEVVAATNPDNSCHGNVRFHADLLGQLVDYWAHEYTEVIITNEALLQLPAAERLLAIMEMIWEHDLAGLDLHLQVWPTHPTSLSCFGSRARSRPAGFESAAGDCCSLHRRTDPKPDDELQRPTHDQAAA